MALSIDDEIAELERAIDSIGKQLVRLEPSANHSVCAIDEYNQLLDEGIALQKELYDLIDKKEKGV